MDRKKSGRMTDIPQLGPEVYIDDSDISRQPRSNLSPLLSPVDGQDARGSFIAHGLDGAARRRRGTESSLGGFVPPGSPGITAAMVSPGISPGVSPQRSPQLSPRHGPHHPHHRANPSAFSFEGGELGSPGGGSGENSRRGSAAENVLQVLDESAWGESIRRSFTMRRPNDRGA